MANAIEMAIGAAIKQAIANMPPEITNNILQIGQTVATFKAQLDRLENQNLQIMQHFGITDIVSEKGNDNGNPRPIERPAPPAG